MWTINTRVKNILLLSSFFTIFSCKNENLNLKNQVTESTETKTISSDTLSKKSDTIAKFEKDEVQAPIDSTKQYVYLTFDDGPFKGSKNISKILTEENVRGTAFLVGSNAFTKTLKEYVEDYKLNPNVDIANHTFSHADGKYKRFYSIPEGVLKDIRKNETELDIHSRWIRLPARNVWRLKKRRKSDLLKDANAAADIISKNQYYIFGWDHEWKRSKSLEDPQKIYEGIVRRLDQNRTFVKNHLVILMHDDMFNTDLNAEKLRQLIILLKNNPKLVVEGISNYPIG